MMQSTGVIAGTPEPLSARRLPPSFYLVSVAGLLVAVTIAALAIGAYRIPVADIAAIAAQALGWAPADPGLDQARNVLWAIRVPRVILALALGAGMGLAGAAMQGMFRNALADPTLIGVAGGAALAAATVIVLGTSWMPGAARLLGVWTLPLAAFSGGLVVAILVYRLATTGGHTALALMLLAGIALNALAESGIAILSYLSTDEQLRNLTFWRLGSVGGSNWAILSAVIPCVVIGSIPLLRLGKSLNALALGERDAGRLGVNVQRLKYITIGAGTLIVGALVSVCGIIFFIGLMAPHLVRLVCGPDHRFLLPGAALTGAVLVVVADLAARTLVPPAELPLGALTALIGAPFFIWLLAKERRRWRP